MCKHAPLFILHSAIDTLAYATGVCISAWLITKRFEMTQGASPLYCIPVLLVSSFGKSLLALTMVWEYPDLFLYVVNVLVFASNFVALQVLFASNAYHAAAVTLSGVAAILFVRVILFVSGLHSSLSIL